MGGFDVFGTHVDPVGDIGRAAGSAFGLNPPGGSPTTQAAPQNPLDMLHQKQLDQAKDFRAGLPSMKNAMAQNMARQSNINTSMGMSQMDNKNNARGLYYGGINAGQKGAYQADAQGKLANSISQGNAGLEGAADTMDANAIQTGVGIQQNAQQIQNQIYAQAVAQMNSQNQMIGSAAGFGLLAAML